MRVTLARALAAVAAMLLALAPTALGQGGAGLGPSAAAPGSPLIRPLNTGMRKAGSYSGAYVVDLNTTNTL
jgi:ABC-type sugar transport system substrate-binding protein